MFKKHVRVFLGVLLNIGLIMGLSFTIKSCGYNCNFLKTVFFYIFILAGMTSPFLSSTITTIQLGNNPT